MSRGKAALRFLHLHSGFQAGDAVTRCVRLINGFGPAIRHTIVSADPDAQDGMDLVERPVAAEYDYDFPPLASRLSLGRLKAIAEAMRGYDLVLTYGWDAIGAAMAHTLFARHFALPAHIHHEGSLGPEEAAKSVPFRSWYRRIALGRSSGLVVPSAALERVALTSWAQPGGRVLRIADGVKTVSFARKPRPDVLPGLIKRKNESWVGTVAEGGAGGDLALVLRSFAELAEEWQLVVLGGPDGRPDLEREAQRMGIEHRVHFPVAATDRAKSEGLFDIFVLAPGATDHAFAVLEAMAAGLPVAAGSKPGLDEVLALENAPFLVPDGGEAALSRALRRLAGDPALRKSVGEANRGKARADHEESTMVRRYGALYASAMGLKALP